MENIKLIVPLSKLKDGDTCFKITGQKPYTVKRSIRIDDQKIECDKSSVFLFSENFIKSYSSDTEVKIFCSDVYEIADMYGVTI